MVIDPAVYALVVDAIAHSGHASASRFHKSSCYGFANSTYSQSYFNATVDRINNIIVNASASTTYQATGYNLTAVEPPLKVRLIVLCMCYTRQDAHRLISFFRNTFASRVSPLLVGPLQDEVEMTLRCL